MQEITTDLEISKELKENGFPQNHLFKWVNRKDRDGDNYYILESGSTYNFKGFRWSAPTAEELLKELPKQVKRHVPSINFGRACVCNNEAYTNKYIVCYADKQHFALNNYLSVDDKLCNALAKYWLYLKKEGLIK